MTSPSEEGSGAADKALKNLENEGPNDCNTEIEPSFVDPNMMSQAETIPMSGEPGTSTFEEHTVSDVVTNGELEVQKTQEDSQKEDSRNEFILIQIPIPKKWIFLMSGLGRISYMSFPLGKNDKNNAVIDGARFHSGKVEMRASDSCHHITKLPFQLSTSWRIPFISNDDIRRMIISLFCGRHFSQSTRCQNTTWVKQKYIAILPHLNVLTQLERNIVPGRPLRVHYYHPLCERMASGKFYKSTHNKGKDGFHIFLRPAFQVPRPQIQNTFSQKFCEDPLRDYRNMSIVIISTISGWKYLCPICGRSFNSFVEFREHSCIFPKN